MQIAGDTAGTSGDAQKIRRQEVTRSGTRNNPARDNPIDIDLAPSALEVNMNDTGRSRMAATIDPSVQHAETR